MSVVFCGVDFGTTNSAVAIAAGTSTELVTLQPSCLFLTEEDSRQRLYVGDEAIVRYLSPGSDGRFIKSIKSLLPDPSFSFTRIRGRQYTPENLVRPVLELMREQVERHTGCSVTKAVFGRPVAFSTDSSRDQLAQERLSRAAQAAGFEEIIFQPEPVAAAWTFATTIRQTRTILVVDLGGGTSDFTVMRVEPPRNGRCHQVLATGGVRVGGDDFDGRIMWHRLVRAFGYGTQYESWGKLLDVPPHPFRAICRWDRIPFLKDTRTREDLKYILSGSTDPEAIQRLITLIQNDWGYALFQAIIQAKHDLSDVPTSHIVFERDSIRIQEEISRKGFEEMIHADVDKIVETAVQTIKRAGLTAPSIDTCFLTGGSSLVRLIRARFEAIVGPERVHSGDMLSSVAIGLALIHQG